MWLKTIISTHRGAQQKKCKLLVKVQLRWWKNRIDEGSVNLSQGMNNSELLKFVWINRSIWGFPASHAHKKYGFIGLECNSHDLTFASKNLVFYGSNWVGCCTVGWNVLVHHFPLEWKKGRSLLLIFRWFSAEIRKKILRNCNKCNKKCWMLWISVRWLRLNFSP